MAIRRSSKILLIVFICIIILGIGGGYGVKYYMDIRIEEKIGNPELDEAKLWRVCLDSLIMADADDVEIGKFLPKDEEEFYESTIRSKIINKSQLPIKVSVKIDIIPVQKEWEYHDSAQGAGWLGIGLGILSGSSLEDTLAGAVGASLAEQERAEKRRMENNATITKTKSIVIAPGGHGWLEIDTGYVSNGISMYEVKNIDLTWPEGRLRDPLECINKWEQLKGSFLSEKVREQYSLRCQEKKDAPTCEYLNAIDNGNSKSELKKLCERHLGVLLGEVTCDRIKTLELIQEARPYQ